MNKLHRHTIVAALAALVALAVVDAGCSNDRPPMTEAFNQADYYVGGPEQTEMRRAELIADIDAAGESIDIAVSRLVDQEVAQALLDAKERGVEVRVVSDWDSWTSPEQADAGLKMLEDNEVLPVYGDGSLSYLPEPTLASVLSNCQVYDDPQYKVCSQGQASGQGTMVRPGSYNLMSHNFAVIDEEVVWNFPPLDDSQQDWIGWRIESSLLAYDFAHEFQQMYGGTFATTLDVYNGPLKSSTDYNVRYFTDKGEMKVWFNPQERLLKTVIDEVYKARSSVWVMTDNLANLDLIDALEYKNNNGFDVRVMIHPDHQAVGESKDRLDAMGVRYAPDGRDHLPTLIVIDQKTDRTGRDRPRKVLALSHPLMRARPFDTEYNDQADKVFIYPSDLFTDGNLWLVQESGSTNHDYELVDQFTRHWDQVWNAAQ